MKPTLDLNEAINEARFAHFSEETGYVLAMTGSRRGMTPEQVIAFAALLTQKLPSTLLHGCCVGADQHADKCYRLMLHVRNGGFHHSKEMTFWKDHIHGYPPIDQSLMMKVDPSTLSLLKPRAYLVRNKKMVNDCDALVAFPDSPIEVVISGTWSTIRYAHKKAIPTLIILPSGALTTYPLDLTT